LKLLLDEMYSDMLAQALRIVDVSASTVIELGLAGRSDPRRPAGISPLVSAIRECADQHLEDRVLYLRRPQQP